MACASNGPFWTIGTMLEGKAPWKAMVFPRSYHSIWDLRLKFWGVLSNSSLLPVILNHSETLGDLPHRPNRLWLMVCFHPGQCDVFLETILEGAGPFNPILMLNTPTSGFPKWIVQMLNGVAFDADQRPKMNHSISPKWKRWLVNLRSPKGAWVWPKKTIWICFKV